MAFNKMFVMLPVMFAASKLDGQDPMVVYYLRIAYGVMQTLNILAVLYTYLQASAASKKFNNLTVYVPPPPTVSIGVGAVFFKWPSMEMRRDCVYSGPPTNGISSCPQ